MKFNIIQKSFGLGDSIVGLYAIYGLIEKYKSAEINYYSHHTNWLKWWCNGYNLKSLSESEECKSDDVIVVWPRSEKNKDNCEEIFLSKIYDSDNRKLFISKCIEENLTPSKPVFDKVMFLRDIKETPIHSGNYVVIAPFATRATRTWPKSSWIYLIDLIKKTLGIDVVLIDGAGDGERHDSFRIMRYWGQSPEKVCNLLWNSKALISNDAGMAHLGGLLDIPTFCIHSQLHSEHLFSLTNVKSIYRTIGCGGCKFNKLKGYNGASCGSGCWVLNSITPDMVIEELVKGIHSQVTI